MYNKGDEYAIPFERIIELAKKKTKFNDGRTGCMERKVTS